MASSPRTSRRAGSAVRRGGAADHDPAREGLEAGARCTVEGGEQGARGRAADLLEVHVDAGQRWPRVAGQDFPVVEAHHGDVAGDVTATLAYGVEDAARDLVAAAEDRVDVGLLPQEHRGRCAPPALGPRAEANVTDERKPGVLEGGTRSVRALLRGAVAGIAGDVGDARPAAGDEVLDREAPGGNVVADDREVSRIIRRRVGVDDRHRELVAQRWARIGAAADDDQAVDATIEQRLHVVLLANRVAARVAEEDGNPSCSEGVLCAHQDWNAETAFEIAGEQAHGTGA